MKRKRIKVMQSEALESISFDYKTLELGMTQHAASAYLAFGGLGWACIRYKLNAGYIVLFLLGFFIVASSWMAYFTLRKLKFSLVDSQDVFSGQPEVYSIQIEAPHRGGIRRNIDVFLADSFQRTTVMPGSSSKICMAQIASGRGRSKAPIFLIQTVQPFGFWRIKAKWQPTSTHWIYPKPEVGAPIFDASNSHDGMGSSSGHGHDTVSGLRPYARGDSARRISWRALARTGGRVLASKQVESQESESYWFTEEKAITQTRDIESMLSRLTAWVMDAHNKKTNYGLCLGNKKIGPDHSPEHLRECLQALASYGIDVQP